MRVVFLHKLCTFVLFLIHLHRCNKDWQVQKYNDGTISIFPNKAGRIFEINLFIYFINPYLFMLIYYHHSVFSNLTS